MEVTESFRLFLAMLSRVGSCAALECIPGTDASIKLTAPAKPPTRPQSHGDLAGTFT